MGVTFLNLGTAVIMKIPKEIVGDSVDQFVDSMVVNMILLIANVLVFLMLGGKVGRGHKAVISIYTHVPDKIILRENSW